MKTPKKPLEIPQGSSVKEYNGRLYVAHPEHPLRFVSVDNEGNCALEDVSLPSS